MNSSSFRPLPHLQRTKIVPPRHECLTFGGVGLFLMGLLVAGSAFRATRVEVGGLLVHPTLLLVPLMFVTFAVTRLHHLPRHFLAAAIVFLTLYWVSSAQEVLSLSILTKIPSSLLMVITTTCMIQSRTDVKAGSVGLCIAVAALSMHGLIQGGDDTSGINPMDEIGNKNSFSLYALPALFVAMYLLMQPWVSFPEKWMLAGCAFITTIALFAIANRSGWICAALIPCLLGFGRRGATTLVYAIALAGGTYYVINEWALNKPFEYYAQRTVDGYDSDAARLEIVQAAIYLGIERPILGTSPQALPWHLSQSLQSGFSEIGPHNTYAFLIGGCGFATMFAFCYVALMLWRRPDHLRGNRKNTSLDSHRILRSFMILWAVRAFFTEEILYAPAFSMGIGLIMGMCAIEGVWGYSYCAVGTTISINQPSGRATKTSDPSAATWK